MIFGFDKTVNANFFYTDEIFDRTRAVFRPIALIQAGKRKTRELGAIDTIFDFAAEPHIASLDFADHPGFRFRRRVNPAARAWVFISSICDADAAIDSARGNHRWTG